MFRRRTATELGKAVSANNQIRDRLIDAAAQAQHLAYALTGQLVQVVVTGVCHPLVHPFALQFCQV